MSEVDALLATEAEHAEQTRDEPYPPDAKANRPGRARSTVFSVRLNPHEVEALLAFADRAGLPASTLVRSWILERISDAGGQTADLRRIIHDEVRDAVREALSA